MSEHTPGPWEVIQTGDNPPSWNIWAEAIADEDATLCHDLYSEADARLIAAAPHLLAACENAADDLNTWTRAFGDAAPSFAIAMDATASMLRYAIKHARGES